MKPEDWTRLCTLIDDDAEAVAAVTLAATDPAGYFEERGEVLRELGMESSDEVDLWQALIDALDEAGALAYLAADDRGEELADALAGVPRVARAGIELDEVGDVVGALADAIREADRVLAAHGLRLVHLDEGTDDVPLVVVPRGSAGEIVALAGELGRTARVFG